jgi:glycosyltransferase involved in cell wall biosynthesis
VKGLAASPGVFVTGFVDDVREYVAAAAVCVAPLRIARGIQNKVLEAMAMGKATVCTPQAIEGIMAAGGDETLVAGEADAFAASVAGLLRDPQRADSIGRAARKMVERQYSWPGNLRLLDDLP